MGRIADILQTRGELDEALRIRREEELPVYKQLGDVHARAVTMGKIADILRSRGELDEALRIRREEQLPVYERLGDVRSRAVTMGKIADILQTRGELDDALRIRREDQLPIYERLGDQEGVANALWSIARIEREKKNFSDACRHLARAYSMLDGLGRVDGRAIVGVDLGQLLYESGEREQGLTILRRSEDDFRRLHSQTRAEQTAKLIRRIGSS
ncbi:MAG: hypothetical protein U1E63_09470 [Burkholderiales bacterium]